MAKLPDRTFGILVNPKDGGLFYAVRDFNGADVTVFDMTDRHPTINSLSGSWIGMGHFHTALEEDEPDPAETLSKYPRVHTPMGVKRKGEGLGTVLYSALCFAAYLNHKKHIRFNILRSAAKPGISSTSSTRTESTDAWWKAAVSKYGIASVNTFCGVESNQISFVSLDKKKQKDVQAAIVRAMGLQKVKSFKIVGGLDVEATYEVCEPVDVMEFSAIQQKHIPLAWLADEYDPMVISPYRTDVSSWRPITRDADSALPLVNADFSRFDERDPKHQQIFLWLATLAKRFGATKRQLDGMRLRFSEGADIEFERKPYVIEQARELGLWEPSSGIIHVGGKTSTAHPIAPRWRPTFRHGASGAVSPALYDELQRLTDARKAMGWAAFSNGD